MQRFIPLLFSILLLHQTGKAQNEEHVICYVKQVYEEYSGDTTGIKNVRSIATPIGVLHLVPTDKMRGTYVLGPTFNIEPNLFKIGQTYIETEAGCAMNEKAESSVLVMADPKTYKKSSVVFKRYSKP